MFVLENSLSILWIDAHFKQKPERLHSCLTDSIIPASMAFNLWAASDVKIPNMRLQGQLLCTQRQSLSQLIIRLCGYLATQFTQVKIIKTDYGACLAFYIQTKALLWNNQYIRSKLLHHSVEYNIYSFVRKVENALNSVDSNENL